MKILQIKYLRDYKIFKKDQIIAFGNHDQSDDTKSHWHYNVLTGSNGSGKSSLLSSIATLFHNIDRFHDRLEFECELIYVIKYGTRDIPVNLTYKDSSYYITIEGEFNGCKILPLNPRKLSIEKILGLGRKPVRGKLYYDNNDIEFYHIKSYLPTSVVLSSFSVHGEYPNNRIYTYRGNPLIKSFDISQIYGKNHFGLPSITRGISRFLKIYYDETVNADIKEILQIFGFTFQGKILVKDGDLMDWIKVDSANYLKYVTLSEAGDVYLNDIMFFRNERDVNFSNMSAGEKMLVYRLISILSEIEEESVVIIEEPELHLDFSWNRQLHTLFKCFFKAFNSQFIVISHHPFIINSISKEQLLILNNGVIEEPTKNTFLSSTEELFDVLYGDKYFINETEESVLNLISETNTKEDLEKLIDNLGNSIYKLIAFEKLNSLK